jgi:hypothetical protein
LRRIAPPAPNPLVDLLKDGKAGQTSMQDSSFKNGVAALSARSERKSVV